MLARRSFRRAGVALAVAVACLVALPARPIEATPPQFVQYQGRLTDSNGAPLEGTVARLTFRLYSSASPSAGTFLWGEVHENVPVSRGVFTVFLGAGARAIDANGVETPGSRPFGGEFEGGAPRYLEVQVGADAPLAPPAPLGGVPYAIAAAGTVPVGGIIEWFRPDQATGVPDGWAVCDGSVVNDARSPFNGKRVPDLRGRFVAGLAGGLSAGYGATGGGAAPGLPEIGGASAVDLSHAHGVTIPAHSHTISADGAHAHGGKTGYSVDPIVGPGPIDNGLPPINPASESAFANPRLHRHEVAVDGAHSHGGVTGPSAGAAGSTATALGAVDVRPPFVGLLKLIRVR